MKLHLQMNGGKSHDIIFSFHLFLTDFLIYTCVLSLSFSFILFTLYKYYSRENECQ